jgi:hypothetical protein
MDTFGPFVKADDNLLRDVGKEEDLSKVIKLFPGGIISSEELTLFVISAEIYGRNGSEDAHAEKNGISFLESFDSENRRHDHMNICLITEGDLKNVLKKLTPGFINFNVLITGSLLVHSPDYGVMVFGPKTNDYIAKTELKLNNTSLFLQ